MVKSGMNSRLVSAWMYIDSLLHCIKKRHMELKSGTLLWEDSRKVRDADPRPYLLLKRLIADGLRNAQYQWLCLFGERAITMNERFLQNCCDVDPHDPPH